MICDDNEIYNAELNGYRNMPKRPIKMILFSGGKNIDTSLLFCIEWKLDFCLYLQLLHPLKEYGVLHHASSQKTEQYLIQILYLI